MAFKVVEPLRPPESENIATGLQGLADRAKAGEFEAVFYVLLRPDGSWATGMKGKDKDPLRMIGLLESLKADLLRSYEIAAS